MRFMHPLILACVAGTLGTQAGCQSGGMSAKSNGQTTWRTLALEPNGAAISVTVVDDPNNDCSVLLLSESNFLRVLSGEDAQAAAAARPMRTRPTFYVRFSGLPAGRYAVVGFRDVDGDDVLHYTSFANNVVRWGEPVSDFKWIELSENRTAQVMMTVPMEIP